MAPTISSKPPSGSAAIRRVHLSLHIYEAESSIVNANSNGRQSTIARSSKPIYLERFQIWCIQVERTFRSASKPHPEVWAFRPLRCSGRKA